VITLLDFYAVDALFEMREKRNAYRILVGKPEGKRLLGRPKHRWVDNIWILERWDSVVLHGVNTPQY
jgi:hypothetical protein